MVKWQSLTVVLRKNEEICKLELGCKAGSSSKAERHGLENNNNNNNDIVVRIIDESKNIFQPKNSHPSAPVN